MRKIKKINGYLIVKFNAHELREWEQLGAYGVIDAELYTGCLNADRSIMEYNSAETLEEAIEQARGLGSEFDIDEHSQKDEGDADTAKLHPGSLSDINATLDYLRRKLDQEAHNLYCYSANYGMTKPRAGYEVEWQKEMRDCELVEELIQSIEREEREKPPQKQAASHYLELKEGFLEQSNHRHTRQNPAYHKQPSLSECSTNPGVIEIAFLRMKEALKEAYPNLVLPEDED